MKTQMFAAVVIAAAITLPALAAEKTADSQQTAVSYADLNLATPAGHAALVARIKQAATKICGDRSDSLRDMAADSLFRACRDKVVADTLAKIPAPAVVAGSSSKPNG